MATSHYIATHLETIIITIAIGPGFSYRPYYTDPALFISQGDRVQIRRNTEVDKGNQTVFPQHSVSSMSSVPEIRFARKVSVTLHSACVEDRCERSQLDVKVLPKICLQGMELVNVQHPSWTKYSYNLAAEVWNIQNRTKYLL